MTKVICCNDFLSLIEEYTLSQPEIQNPQKISWNRRRKRKSKINKQRQLRSAVCSLSLRRILWEQVFKNKILPELTRDRRVFSGYVNNQLQLKIRIWMMKKKTIYFFSVKLKIIFICTFNFSKKWCELLTKKYEKTEIYMTFNFTEKNLCSIIIIVF